MKRIPRDPSAHGDGSTWTVFDCREINDLTRIYPFGSLNQRWSGAWLITSTSTSIQKEIAWTSPAIERVTFHIFLILMKF